HCLLAQPATPYPIGGSIHTTALGARREGHTPHLAQALWSPSRGGSRPLADDSRHGLVLVDGPPLGLDQASKPGPEGLQPSFLLALISLGRVRRLGIPLARAPTRRLDRASHL